MQDHCRSAEVWDQQSFAGEDLDFRQLARDIEPFIFSRDDTKKVLLFREFVESL